MLHNFKNKVTWVMSHFLPRYFAHPENLLLCGFLSPFSTDYVREQSLKKILEARKKQRASKAKKVRRFFPPSLDKYDFEAANIFDFLRWDMFKRNYVVTPPPLLSKYTDDELKEMLKTKTCPEIEGILCHSQHNERCVKQTTMSILKNAGYEQAKANIIVTDQSRQNFVINAPKKNVIRALEFDK